MWRCGDAELLWSWCGDVEMWTLSGYTLENILFGDLDFPRMGAGCRSGLGASGVRVFQARFRQTSSTAPEALEGMNLTMQLSRETVF